MNNKAKKYTPKGMRKAQKTAGLLMLARDLHGSAKLYLEHTKELNDEAPYKQLENSIKRYEFAKSAGMVI